MRDLVKLVTFIKACSKNLGFLEAFDQLLDKRICFEIEREVFSEITRSQKSGWDDAFETSRHYYEMHKRILKVSRSKNNIWRYRSYILGSIRLIWNIVDVLTLFAQIGQKYVIAIKESGQAKSAVKIFVYTNGASRADVLNSNGKFHQVDFLITKNPPRNYRVSNKVRISGVMLMKIVYLKLKYHYVLGDTVIRTVVAELLFRNAMADIILDGYYYGAFSREAWTPVSRVFLKQAKVNGISTTVFYTRAVAFECMYVPKKIDNLLICCEKSIPEFHEATSIVRIYDYPFLNWRKISSNLPREFCIGLLLSDEYDRWGEQDMIDKDILDALSQLGNVKCIGRPHPQELSRAHRRAYYEELTDKYPFLEIDIGNPEIFLSKINMLISYAKSSMVQEAVMCKRFVIEYAPDPTFSPNERVIALSAKMAVSCSSIEKLLSLLKDYPSSSKLQSRWEEAMKIYGLKSNQKNTLEQCIQNCVQKIKSTTTR